MSRTLRFLLIAFALALPARAQTIVELFNWPAAGLLLRLPPEYQAEEAAEPELVIVRALDAPLEVELRWWPEDDAGSALDQIFAEAAVEARAPGLLLGRLALHVEGRRAGETWLLARALDLPGRGGALTLTTAASDAGLQPARMALERIAAGLLLDEGDASLGVVWQRVAFASEGRQAFFEISGMAFQIENRLLILNPMTGVFVLDAASGRTLELIPLPDSAEPEALAAARDGRIALADSLCACVHLWEDGRWSQPLQNFAPGAPRFIAFAGATLYATDQSAEGAFVRSLSPDGQAGRIFFEDFIEQQPRLFYAAQRGTLLVLTSDFEVYEAEGAGFSPRALLATVPDEQAAVTVDAAGRFMVANSYRELLLFDDAGMLIADALLQWPNDLVAPVDYPLALALDDDSGTLFIAESSSGYGRVMALRPDSQPQRVGLRLVPGMIAAGVLNAEAPTQAWPLSAPAGPQQITALPSLGADLMLRLQIVDETGAVLAETAETSLEAPEPGVVQLSFTLERARDLYLLVTAESGEGDFQVGMRRTERLGSGRMESRRGAVDAARPAERWIFDGTAGQGVTITMSALTGTLDPLLRLLDVDGVELALNDDAENIELGRDSQIFEFRLPASGEYIIEASRFDGVGEYQLDFERLD